MTEIEIKDLLLRVSRDEATEEEIQKFQEFTGEQLDVIESILTEVENIEE